MLHPARRVGDLGEAGGVALREAVGAETFELAEGALGEVARVAAGDHAFDQLFRNARRRPLPEGRHRTAQLVRLGRREAGSYDSDLHRLFNARLLASRFGRAAALVVLVSKGHDDAYWMD